MRWLFLLLFLTPSSYAVMFNEVMYDLIGSDDNKEWIEIINEGNASVNLQNWKFFEDGTNHNLILIQGSYVLAPAMFAVIAENPVTFLADHANFTGTLLDSTFSLSNTGETLVLKNKTGQVQDNLTYSFLWGGSETGFTIGVHGDVWKETVPTPGFSNDVSNACDWSVSIITNKIVFEDPTDFSWKVQTQRQSGEPRVLVTISRSITDIYGVAAKTYGDLVHNITTRETLSYDPNLKPGTYVLKGVIIPACNDTNAANNAVELLVAIKDQQMVTKKDSDVDIVQLYDLGKDERAQFGQLIRVKIKAYRGDTGKQVVSVWVEKNGERFSKILDFKLLKKFSEQEFTAPIQIFPNCNQKYKDGSYRVVAEGLGTKDSVPLSIADNTEGICGKTAIKAAEKTTTAKKQESAQGAVQQPSRDSFNAGKPFTVSTILFESTQRKAEQLVPYALSFVFAMTIVLLFVSSKTGS